MDPGSTLLLCVYNARGVLFVKSNADQETEKAQRWEAQRQKEQRDKVWHGWTIEVKFINVLAKKGVCSSGIEDEGRTR